MLNPEWTVITDLGTASALLLFGQLIRAKVKPIQKLFLPASVLAGFMCLILGPNGFDLLPFSSRINQYPAWLIALVFASLPFSSNEIAWKKRISGMGRLWSYSAAIFFLQWGGGVAFTYIVIQEFRPDINIGFGTILASGFTGGHGTAVAVGTSLATNGWPDGENLAMTFATIGLLTSIIGGMFWINWGVLTGSTRHLEKFSNLPKDITTGLVSPGQRESLGEETTSPISIDPLIFQVAIVLTSTLIGSHLSRLSELALTEPGVPIFCSAFLSAIALKIGFRRFGGIDYVESKTMRRIGGACTDFLVVFGIASIQISVVLDYALPLFSLYAFGLCMSILLFRLVAQKIFGTGWFETALFTWGWTTGVIAMGVALLRIIDAKNKDHVLDDFAIAYFALVPIEIALITISPYLIINGYHLHYMLVTITFGLFLLWQSIYNPGVLIGPNKSRKF